MIGLLLAAAMRAPLHYDVLISAGHEGRPGSCVRYPRRACNLGAAGERDWTPVVADEAARALRAAGYSVAREPADFNGTFDVKTAIFVHFDGSTAACSSGASIGYPNRNSEAAAQLWRRDYGSVFPFHFQPDNFTDSLHEYYGFRQVRAERGALVLELGEVTCPAQRSWLSARLHWEGDFIARFIRQLVGTP